MRAWKCPQCGIDYGTISPGDTIVAVRSFPRRYRGLLRGLDDDEGDPEALIRRRPDPGTWSALEYTAHVADVLDDLAGAIGRMTVEREPVLSSFDPDVRAEGARYNERERDEVLEGLRAAADHLAQTLERVQPDDWLRQGHLPYGDRDILTMARNAVHEGAHHLRDVERVLRQVRGRPPATP